MGKSESRFIMGPVRSPNFDHPNGYMHPENHNYGAKIVIRKRNTSDRYEKFKVQETEHGTYIRFDKHPQPGIRVKKDHSVEMYNASWDKRGEWGIIVLGIQDPLGESRFTGTKNSIQWDAGHMKKTKRMRVMLYNKDTKEYLRTKSTNKGYELCTGPFEGFKNEMSRESIRNYVCENGFVWEMEYVTNEMSAGEVATAVLLPAGAVIGLAGGVLGMVAGFGEVAAAGGWAGILGVLGTGTGTATPLVGLALDDTAISELLEAAIRDSGVSFAMSGQAAFGKELGTATIVALMVSVSMGIVDLKIDMDALVQKAKARNKLQAKL